jgi:hypothetical protein
MSLLASGLSSMDFATASKSYRLRAVRTTTRQKLKVGDQEGHLVLVFEETGIQSNRQGREFQDAWMCRDAGVWDTSSGTHGYEIITDKDGDKLYMAWESTAMRGDGADGTCILVDGTGKFEGIKGKGTWFAHNSTDPWQYVNFEFEVESAKQ